MNIIENATLTGGTTVTLRPSGLSPGRSTYTGPGHTRLEPETVDFTVSGSNSGSNPTAKSGVKIVFADRQVEEGCCTVREGAVTIDLGVRYQMNQPESVVNAGIERLIAIVTSPSFPDMVKKGILPTG